MSHGGEVEAGIGGAAESDEHCDRVFKSLFRHDVARLEAEFDEIEDGGSGIEAVAHLVVGNGGLGGAVRE